MLAQARHKLPLTLTQVLECLTNGNINLRFEAKLLAVFKIEMSPDTYLVSMKPHCLDSILTQFVSVEAGSSAVVLLLRVVGVAVVRPEEGARPGVASQLHLSQLLPCPVGVKIGGPDEGQVHSQRPAQNSH